MIQYLKMALNLRILAFKFSIVACMYPYFCVYVKLKYFYVYITNKIKTPYFL